MLDEALEVERPRVTGLRAREERLQVEARIEPLHATAFGREERLEDGGTEPFDGRLRLHRVLGHHGLRHRHASAHQLDRHPRTIDRGLQLIGSAEHRHATRGQMPQHGDPLLDDPAVGGVTDLFDHDGAQSAQRLASDPQLRVGQAHAAGRQVNDDDGGAGVTQRGGQPFGGPAAGLADDGDSHAAIPAARSSWRTPSR